jgi:hypothetical protein
VRTLALVVALLAVVAIATSVASGGSVQRFRVVDAGRPETQAFPPDVFLTIESPGPYVATADGVWTGPTYWPDKQPSQTGTSTLQWAVEFRDRSDNTAETAAAATANGWPEDQHSGISVPLVVGDRQVGALPAFFVIKEAPAPERARFVAALVVPLGPSAQTVVRFTSSSPTADSSPFGDYLVQGAILASTWNRGQILIALSQVRVEGNLAPNTVSIRVEPGKRVVRGKVVDAFANPLVGTPVVEQRWNGVGWKPFRAGRTTAKGEYHMAAARGRYRIAASNGGTTVTSAFVTFR